MKTLGSSPDRKEILTRVNNLSRRDDARWGRMSVHQMLCHLADSYCIALGDKIASPATSILARTVIKPLALWMPLQWKKGYKTVPEVEQGKGGSPPTEFEADRDRLRLIVCRFCDSLPCPCFPHPVFGDMNQREWLRWGYLHADHHLRQFGR